MTFFYTKGIFFDNPYVPYHEIQSISLHEVCIYFHDVTLVKYYNTRIRISVNLQVNTHAYVFNSMHVIILFFLSGDIFTGIHKILPNFVISDE